MSLEKMCCALPLPFGLEAIFGDDRKNGSLYIVQEALAARIESLHLKAYSLDQYFCPLTLVGNDSSEIAR